MSVQVDVSRLRSVALASAALVTATLLTGCGETGAVSGVPVPVESVVGSATTTPSGSVPPEHTISVVYDDPQTRSDAFAEHILDVGGLGGVAEGFSQNFVFPVDLTIHVSSGEGSPYYDPSTRTVTLFYGFATTTARILKTSQPGLTGSELGAQWAAVNDFILIHELGHAFVDVFDLPITGREEDAVDGLATVFFTDDVPGGADYAFDAARFFHFLQQVQGEPDADQFQDEHSLSVQRSYDIACSVAGSSAATMRQIARMGILSPARLQRCPAEYQQKSHAWNVLLQPYIRAS